MAFTVLIKWLILWAVFTATVYFLYKATYALVKKPNLRYYVIKTLKDMKYLYYRYHV